MTQGYTTFQYTRFNSGGIYTFLQRYGHSRLRAEIYINRFLQANSPGEPGSLHLWLMMSAPASLATGPFSASFGFLLEAWMILIRTSMEFGDGENALCHACLAAWLPGCLFAPGHKSSPTPQQELIVITIPSVQRLLQSSCYASL